LIIRAVHRRAFYFITPISEAVSRRLSTVVDVAIISSSIGYLINGVGYATFLLAHRKHLERAGRKKTPWTSRLIHGT
jgi:hypothetical protein